MSKLVLGLADCFNCWDMKTIYQQYNSAYSTPISDKLVMRYSGKLFTYNTSMAAGTKGTIPHATINYRHEKVPAS